MQLDSVTGLQMQVKRVGELIPFTFVFTNLAVGETISNIASFSQTRRGIVTGSIDLTAGAQSHDSGANGQVWLSGGTDGEFYCVTLIVNTSAGAIRSCSGVLQVKEAC